MSMSSVIDWHYKTFMLPNKNIHVEQAGSEYYILLYGSDDRHLSISLPALFFGCLSFFCFLLFFP